MRLMTAMILMLTTAGALAEEPGSVAYNGDGQQSHRMFDWGAHKPGGRARLDDSQQASYGTPSSGAESSTKEGRDHRTNVESVYLEIELINAIR